MGSCGFSVDVKSSEVIAAILPLPKHWLPMSNLDLLLPPFDVGVFLCYKSNQSNFDTIVEEIKKALAQVLVSFYPFAGEIVTNIHGEPEILCNNRGVDFVHAFYDADLKVIDLHHPDISVQGKLFPFKKHGVLAVQVTELKCGGLVVGCTFDHRVADAYSANIFLTRWSELITIAAASTKTTSKTHAPPSFRRSLLNPRHPPYHDSFIDEMYVKIGPPKSLNNNENNNKLISRIYYIESEQINRLQSLASYNGCKRTKLESFSAFLWKTIAHGEGNCNVIKLGIVVDGRQRLKFTEEEEEEGMGNYFGNVLSIPYKQASVSQLKNMQLKNVANMVHECIKSAANQEHFLDLIDWVELQRPEPAMVKICHNFVDEEGIVVSSGLRFPSAAMDFGMGKPCFGSYHFPWGGQTGYVMPMPSLSRQGDWIVYMHLLKKHLDVIDKNAANVFMPYCSALLF